MQALVVQPDGPAAVVCREWPTPQPSAGEVLVQVRFAALNRNDAMLLDERGELGGPCVIGADGAGRIVDVGEGVDPDRLGEEVVILPTLDWGDDEAAPADGFGLLGYPRQGTHAEYVAIPAENAFTKPATIDWVHAAALPLAGLTAWRAVITKARARSGATLLVSGASGGVATLAIQIASGVGAAVHVTASTQTGLDHALHLGASGGTVRSEGWADRLRAEAGEFDAVIDGGGASWVDLVGLLRRGGTLVTFGRSASSRAELDVFDVFWRHITIAGTSLGTSAEFQDLLDHVAAASWRPTIDRVLPLRDGALAYEALDGAHLGKVVLQIS